VSWPVVILTARGATVGETVNVGIDGAFIICRVPLLRDEKFRVFIMAPNRQALNISVDAAWSNPYSSEEDNPPKGMGIRFTQISPADRQFLSDFIAENYSAEDDI
jgi:hypothetical protein